MKGIFKINPPTPRYKTTWDPHIVLNYLSSLGTGDKLTLKLLSMKLLMLTALVSAQRGQSLHMLDIRFMKEYLRRTKPLRGDSTKLFISFMKAHKHISRETLSRWIKTVIEAAGIDTSIFHPHSTRAAATSKAKETCVPIQ